jgi:hypothetical protein
VATQGEAGGDLDDGRDDADGGAHQQGDGRGAGDVGDAVPARALVVRRDLGGGEAVGRGVGVGELVGAAIEEERRGHTAVLHRGGDRPQEAHQAQERHQGTRGSNPGGDGEQAASAVGRSGGRRARGPRWGAAAA